jgi:hypothetical protein
MSESEGVPMTANGGDAPGVTSIAMSEAKRLP